MRRIFLGLAVAGLSAIVVLGAVRWLHPAVGPSVPGVLADRLSQFVIVMLNPFPWDPPQFRKAKAAHRALMLVPGGASLQTVLAEVVLITPPSPKPRLCWVVSMPGSL